MREAVSSSRDVIIRTGNWSEAVRFYESTLGFAVCHRSADLVGFETGAFRLYVERGAPHGATFDFLVADVAATKARLVAAGCTLVEENPGMPRCYLRDPHGLTFNIGVAAER